MQEIDYYRTQSGSTDPNLSQQDYELIYFQDASGLPVGLSLDDYKRDFYATETGYENREDAEYWYFANAVSDTSFTQSLEDLKKIFFDMQ